MKSLPIVLLLTFLLAHPASAKFFSAELLIKYLDSGDCEENNKAHGYIVGVYDSFEGTLYAQHQSMSEDQLVQIVVDYIRSRPKQRAYSAQIVVMRAIEVYFKEKDGGYNFTP